MASAERTRAADDVPKTKQERVYQALRERILSATYGPGFRIVIDVIAAEFEVSALPVREAIRRLEAEGLVIYRPNAGAQVAPADPSAYDDELTVLAVLEGHATALAAPLLDKRDVAELRRITDEMVTAMESLDALGFGRRNQEFHALIHSRCPNVALVNMVRDVTRRLDAIRRTVFVQIPYRGVESIDEHRALIELVVDRAGPEQVEHAARQHKLHTVGTFRRWQARTGGGR